jgi:phosphohistidine phosphatase
MLTLILLRHAKSSWDHPGLADFDRPLAERGTKAAPRIAAFIARKRLVPDLVLCSSARRARDTLGLAIGEWKPRPGIEYSDELYMASPGRLLQAVQAVSVDIRRLMLIGHNPGIETLAFDLTGSGDARGRSAMAAKFPTAAFAVIEFDTDAWSAIRPGAGRLSQFVTPRKLARGKG